VERARGRGRKPRLEFLTLLAPAVEPVLRAEGFEVEGRLPLMLCERDELMVPLGVDDLELLVPSTDADFDGAALAQWEAYGGAGAPPARVARSLGRVTRTGGLVVLARKRTTGEPAGAGLVTAPSDGVAELTSVGVRTHFRRRGIAAAMTGWLAQHAFERGLERVFLMAAGEAEARIYERVGFSKTSDVLHISLD
jgi:ribosomal protein S18 acetylase RimI-like enzyme